MRQTRQHATTAQPCCCLSSVFHWCGCCWCCDRCCCSALPPVFCYASSGLVLRVLVCGWMCVACLPAVAPAPDSPDNPQRKSLDSLLSSVIPMLTWRRFRGLPRTCFHDNEKRGSPRVAPEHLYYLTGRILGWTLEGSLLSGMAVASHPERGRITVWKTWAVHAAQPR